METGWIQALMVDGNRLWVGTADGLFLAEGDRIQKLRSEDVHTLFQDGDTLWMGTRSGLVALSTAGLDAVASNNP
jgi:ligand-binding sensor domain-containing protein